MAHKGIPYIGASAEVWALGGVLHSMLTATLPYRIETYQQNWMTYRPPQKRSEDCQELLNSIFQYVPVIVALVCVRLLSHVYLSSASLAARCAQ